VDALIYALAGFFIQRIGQLVGGRRGLICATALVAVLPVWIISAAFVVLVTGANDVSPIDRSSPFISPEVQAAYANYFTSTSVLALTFIAAVHWRIRRWDA